MRVKDKTVQKLLGKYKEISTLGKINGLLGWDMNVNLPPQAAEGRAAEMAYLAGVITDKWLDPEFSEELLAVSGKGKTKELKNLGTEERAIVRNLERVDESYFAKASRDEQAIIRNLTRSARFYLKVPKEIIVEFSETTSRAFMVWQKAKEENKFADFLPHLEKIVKLNRIIAEHLGYRDNPYDALLDLYEPELTAKKCEEIFAVLQPELTKLLKAIRKSQNPKNTRCVKLDHPWGGKLDFPVDDQRQVAMFALRKMGYDLEAGRMDVSSHPFTTELDRFDVRITNRYKTSDFRESLMVAMHEGGHALYEQGINADYDGTPLESGVSLGIHESQSRFWENQVGRSYEFIKFMTPVLHAFYPEQLGKFGADELFIMFNEVKPSFIRTEADEVTYNLHIALRFKIEDGLINGKIKIKDLPEIWRDKMKKYLGVVPPTDREGVLQDVHWAYGNFGYFPTYTLGNLYAAQFAREMRKEIEIEKAAEAGELGTILSWLRTNIHQYGSLYWPEELIQEVSGEPLNPKYFLEYIKGKYGKLYGVKL
jgi:carboxypeptidase Taq